MLPIPRGRSPGPPSIRNASPIARRISGAHAPSQPSRWDPREGFASDPTLRARHRQSARAAAPRERRTPQSRSVSSCKRSPRRRAAARAARDKGGTHGQRPECALRNRARVYPHALHPPFSSRKRAATG